MTNKTTQESSNPIEHTAGRSADRASRSGKPRSGSRRGRAIGSLLVTLGLLAGTSVLAAPQASAAGTANVTVCYKVVPENRAYVKSTYVQYYDVNGRWQPWLSAGPTANGCRTWSLAAGYSYKFVAQTLGETSSFYYYGSTLGYSYSAGTYRHDAIVAKMF